MMDEKQPELKDLLPLDPRAVPAVFEFIGAISTIPAIFVLATTIVELANLGWGPYSDTAYLVASFGLWFCLLLLAIPILQWFGKGEDGQGNDETAKKGKEVEPDIFQFGFARIMTFYLRRIWLFPVFIVFFLFASRLLRDGDSEPVVKDSYFWDTLIAFGKGFGFPLLGIVGISLVIGLIEKRKRAAP